MRDSANSYDRPNFGALPSSFMPRMPSIALRMLLSNSQRENPDIQTSFLAAPRRRHTLHAHEGDLVYQMHRSHIAASHSRSLQG